MKTASEEAKTSGEAEPEESKTSGEAEPEESKTSGEAEPEESKTSGEAATETERDKFEEVPPTFTAGVWEHFGFAVEYNDAGERTVDKAKTVCKHCLEDFIYKDWSTSNMKQHLRCHHADVTVSLKRPATQILDMELWRAMENRKRKAMTSAAEAEFEEVPPTSRFKSKVWEHFGFAVAYDDAGERTVDKTNVVCKLCMQGVRYADWSTSSMNEHLRRHHNLSISQRRLPTQVLVLGLDGAGKTSLIRCFSTGAMSKQNVLPTDRFNVVAIQREGQQIEFFEIGGREDLRLDYWQNYMPKALVLVFVIDASDKDRFALAKTHLQGLLAEADPKLPLVVLSNKREVQGSYKASELLLSLADAIGDKRPYHIIDTCAVGVSLEDSGVQNALYQIFEMVKKARST